LPVGKLSEIFCSLVVRRISYCVSFLNVEYVGRINAPFKRANRYGFTEHNYDFHGIMERADEELFKRIQSKEHCLHSVLPPVKYVYREIRNHGHNFTTL
jgi:hypothetical protein